MFVPISNISFLPFSVKGLGIGLGNKKMQLLEKYKNKGFFTFKHGEKLSLKCKEIPNDTGVYLVYAVRANKKELVYIGASGKMNQNGTFKIQKLKKRIQNMQNSKTRRETHFNNEISNLKLISIEVRWYVTFDSEFNDLPLNVEGTILQEFYSKNGVLPLWNNQA
jgi:hypothetical protein